MEWITISDASRIFGIKEATIRNAARKGYLLYDKRGGTAYVSKDEIEHILAMQNHMISELTELYKQMEKHMISQTDRNLLCVKKFGSNASRWNNFWEKEIFKNRKQIMWNYRNTTIKQVFDKRFEIFNELKKIKEEKDNEIQRKYKLLSEDKELYS